MSHVLARLRLQNIWTSQPKAMEGVGEEDLPRIGLY